MPYRIAKNAENRYCVNNTETGESKGCSDTREMAVRHMAALYANEKKSLDEVDELVTKAAADFTAETGEAFSPEELAIKQWYAEDSGFWPMGATSYAEVDAQLAAFKAAQEADRLVQMFPTLARNILYQSEVSPADKGQRIKDLAGELADKLAGEVSDSVDDTEEKAISKREDVSSADKKRAVGEYGDVKYADEKNKKYPIDTPEHIRAAWNYINKAGNAAKYSSGEVSQIKSKIVSAWKSKIDKAGPPSASKSLKDGISEITEQFSNFLKSVFFEEDETNDPPVKDLLFYKDDETGQYRWIARYSNNFLDKDNPPDIISAQSHRRYVEMIDKGAYPYPVIQLWHQKEWTFGKADWLAFDDAGFALASGYVYPGYEAVAESLTQCKDIGMSHGMPIASIARDPADNRVITEHQTVELSVLPASRAANPLTSFHFMKETTEEVDMAIPKEKKAAALKDWGVDESLLNQIESLNKKDADAANKAGIASKDAPDQTDTPPAAETPPADNPPVDTPQATTDKASDTSDPADAAPSRTEVADVMAKVFEPTIAAIKELQDLVGKLNERMETVEKQAKETKDRKAVEAYSPLASLMSSLQMDRAVGSTDTAVKDGDPLADKKPKEAPAQMQEGPTGIQWVNQLLAGTNK